MSDKEGGDDSSSASSSEEEEERPTKRTKTDDDEPASASTSTTPKTKHQPIIILLDQATLETYKNKHGVFELLNCDDHREVCKRKLKKDPNNFRPDILHQALLALMDSPLNKAGLLKIYVQTQKKVLIDIHPSVRIPRTFKRFAGLMVQLLHKMKIKAGAEGMTLLKVIKSGTFSQYLPTGTRCYGLTSKGKLYTPLALARSKLSVMPSLDNDDDDTAVPSCFVVGAMSVGHVKQEDHPYIEEMISVSEYPLSSALTLSRIVCGIEEHWGIV